jgi:hypothetical protein
MEEPPEPMSPVRSITCPTCGKVGTITGEWGIPGVASGPWMTGRDPETCSGCWDALVEHGYSPGKREREPGGRLLIHTLDRPTDAHDD